MNTNQQIRAALGLYQVALNDLATRVDNIGTFEDFRAELATARGELDQDLAQIEQDATESVSE